MTPYTQANKLLRIQTFLDADPTEKKFAGDPLLLAKLDGSEGISSLFSYDVVILRNAQRPKLDLMRLLNTRVDFGSRSSNADDDQFYYRTGIIETMREALDLDEVKFLPFPLPIIPSGTQRSFHIYRARLVPAVKMLARDGAYRVFEEQSALDILTAIKIDIEKTYPKLVFIDLSSLQDQKFPKLDYVVQFGETTLDFMFRIMACAGIGYYFGHKLGPEGLMNETMILLSENSFGFPPCHQAQMKTDKDPSMEEVSALTQQYHPPQRRFDVGGFNQTDPQEPFQGSDAIDPLHDMLANDGCRATDALWSATAKFGENFTSNEDANSRAKALRLSGQSDAFTVSGTSANPSFLAGHSFDVTGKDAKDPARASYIIETLTLNVHDYNYENLFGWQILDIFFNTYSGLDSDSGSALDGPAAAVSHWISNAAQNWTPPLWFWKHYYGNTPTAPGVLNTTSGSAVVHGGWQYPFGLFWLLLQNVDLKKMLADWKSETGFANGFIAVPQFAWNRALSRSFPLPNYVQPKVGGVHAAVVIGKNGSDPKGQDICGDQRGRVRIRFPWDPGPAVAPGKLPRWQQDRSHPWKSGENACWARVSEGWAGHGFGTQFLPRVGQEVLVDFLDGDPEQPIIIGRVYNSAGGAPNLPFAQGADANAHGFLLSGLRTRSSPKPPSGKERYHLLRFDDTYGDEQLLIRSQARMDITAKGTLRQAASDQHFLCTSGYDEATHTTTNGNFYITTGYSHFGVPPHGNYDLHVGGSRFEQVDGPDFGYQLTVKKDLQLDVEQNSSSIVKGTMSLNASSIVLEAAQKITLKVGSSTIVLNACGVYLDGAMVYQQCGGPADKTSDLTFQNIVDASAADPGEPPNSRLGSKSGGGGGRGSHVVKAQHAPECVCDNDNMISTELGPWCGPGGEE